MTSDELKAWIDRNKLTHEAAAKILRLSVPSLRKRLYGHAEVGAQTERIIELWGGRG